jgi:molecular chaperone DnaK (HSP70)
MRSVGLDFGTTNSAIGIADESGVRLAKFAHAGELISTFRSILYFHPDARDKVGRYEAVAGPRAISKYLEASGTGRLIQSLKSYLADRGFQATSIYGRTHTIVDLVTLLLADLRARAEEELGPLGKRIVVGRPVHFAHGDSPEDETLAIDRLKQAFARVGFTDVSFEYEPVAAAYYYEQSLDATNASSSQTSAAARATFRSSKLDPRIARAHHEKFWEATASESPETRSTQRFCITWSRHISVWDRRMRAAPCPTRSSKFRFGSTRSFDAGTISRF